MPSHPNFLLCATISKLASGLFMFCLFSFEPLRCLRFLLEPCSLVAFWNGKTGASKLECAARLISLS